MKRLPAALAAILLAQAAASAQNSVRLHTRPAVPAPESLDRLHLKMAWRTYVPTGGHRDGIFSVQLLDHQVLVQTQSGQIEAIDADTGVSQWHVHVGTPYKITHRVAANKQSVFAVRSGVLFDLDRKTGRVRWEFAMPGAPSAAPVADDERIYLCLGTGHVYTYMLPEAIRDKEKKPAEGEASSPAGVRSSPATAAEPPTPAADAPPSKAKGPEPVLLWDYQPDTRIERAPLLTDDRIVLAGSDGTFVVMSQVKNDSPEVFPTGATLSAPIGHHATLTEDELHLDEIAYVASRDYNLYAVDTVKARIVWRFTAGSPIFHKPEVTDDDVYVTAEQAGLYRLKRETGEQIWHNPQAQRFLSMNKKFVYATDRVGRLLVLDRARGSQRAVYDASGFVVPVSNEWTDRFFLASNDGLLICLHDRDYPKPLTTKTVPERRILAEEKAETKAEAKPKDEAKEKEPAKDEAKKKEERKPPPKPKPAEKPKEGDKQP